jgi:hypothetical protein
MEGDSVGGYQATQLAKDIAASEGNEALALIQKACIQSKAVCEPIQYFFHGDTVSKPQSGSTHLV